MRMQVILDSSFARPGSAPKRGGKKVEFRDWTKEIKAIDRTEDIVPMRSTIAATVTIPRLTSRSNISAMASQRKSVIAIPTKASATARLMSR